MEKSPKLYALWRPTDSWVRVHQRRFCEQNLIWRVRRRGDLAKGSILLKVQEASSMWSIFTQVCTVSDTVHWLRTHGQESISRQQADAYLRAATARDPDLWIIETEKAVMSRNVYQKHY